MCEFYHTKIATQPYFKPKLPPAASCDPILVIDSKFDFSYRILTCREVTLFSHYNNIMSNFLPLCVKSWPEKQMSLWNGGLKGQRCSLWLTADGHFDPLWSFWCEPKVKSSTYDVSTARGESVLQRLYVSDSVVPQNYKFCVVNTQVK